MSLRDALKLLESLESQLDQVFELEAKEAALFHFFVLMAAFERRRQNEQALASVLREMNVAGEFNSKYLSQSDPETRHEVEEALERLLVRRRREAAEKERKRMEERLAQRRREEMLKEQEAPQRLFERELFEGSVLAAQAISEGVCTASLTGNKFALQPFFSCVTCNHQDNDGCCQVCLTVCHAGHQWRAFPPDVPSYCDCGTQNPNCKAFKKGQENGAKSDAENGGKRGTGGLAAATTSSQEARGPRGAGQKGNETFLRKLSKRFSLGRSDSSQSQKASTELTSITVDSSNGHSNRHVTDGGASNALRSIGSSSAPDSDQICEIQSQQLLAHAKREVEQYGVFTDQEFMPGPKSLFVTPSAVTRPDWLSLEWRRVTEFGSPGTELELFKGETDPSDIHQGELGDCWLLSAISVLASHPQYIAQLFHPATSTFNPAGYYVVRFWQNGKRRPVLVDDVLPCRKQENQFVPAFVKMSSSPSAYLPTNEIWAMILEKAYAKLHRSYEAIEGGLVDLALVDLTGGVSERLSLRGQDPTMPLDVVEREDIWKKLKHYHALKYLLGCGSPSGSDRSGINSVNGLGIVQGHAYGVIDVQEVDEFRLLRVRNPWGQVEWRGSWSHDSPQWTKRMRRKLNYYQTRHDAGTFWISFDDFCANFDDVYVCRIFNSSPTEGGPVWHKKRFESQWKGPTAGGCTNFDSVENNPQFLVSVETPTNLFISLAQDEYRGQGRSAFAISIEIYQNRGHKIKRTSYGTFVGSNPRSYCQTREVSCEIVLYPQPHPYTVLVSTFHPGEETGFAFTVFSNNPVNIKQV